VDKQEINLAELFRQKLENAEIVPDSSVRSELMRKLSIREFLRFNPSRINIWYAGLFLVASVIAALIISSAIKRSDTKAPVNIPIDTIRNVSSVKDEQSAGQKSDKLAGRVPVPVSRKVKIPDKGNGQEGIKTNRSAIRNDLIVTDVNGSSAKKGLSLTEMPGKNKLQGGLMPGRSLFGTSVAEGCAPLKVHFNIRTESFDSCRWAFGDGGYSNQRDPEWIFDMEGEYKVVLNIYSSGRLQATSSAAITVYTRPVARFEIDAGKDSPSENQIRILNYSRNATHFKWDFGDGSASEIFEPWHSYAKHGNYNVGLVAYSDYGCSDSLLIMNTLSGSEYFIDFPNAFIPDEQGPSGGFYSSRSDETSRVFHPVFSGVSDYQLKIFSKLGILIFESNDINLGWDGYIRGQLSTPGVYIWKVRGNFRNGEPFIKMGDVTLLKNR
jgi:PKD repeat protein